MFEWLYANVGTVISTIVATWIEAGIVLQFFEDYYNETSISDPNVEKIKRLQTMLMLSVFFYITLMAYLWS